MILPFLSKAKAELEMHAEERCLPGAHLPVEVRLRLKKELKPRQLRLELVGQERYYVRKLTRIGSRQQEEQVVATFARLSHVVAEQGSFGPDADQRWNISLPVPLDAPPSCRGQLVNVCWTLRAILDVPSRRDQVKEMSLQVLNTAPIHIANSRADGSPPSTEKSFEECTLTLESPQVLAPGALLLGRIRIQMMHRLQVRGIRVELVQHEEAGDSSTERIVKSKKLSGQAVFNPNESHCFEFSLILSPDAPPTMVSPHSSLRWRVLAVLDRRMRTDFNVEQDVYIHNAPALSPK